MHSPGQAKRHPGLFHVVDGRPAKGKSVDNVRTDNAFALTARKDNNTLHPGCRFACPGLCAAALTARAGQCVLCEQVVRVNQEQFHFGYNKLDTRFIIRTAT